MTPEGEVRQRKALRLMVVVLIPLAIWTVAGLIVLWPGDISEHIGADTTYYSVPGVTFPTGEITKTTPISCEGQVGSTPGVAQECAVIEVELLEGPELGQVFELPPLPHAYTDSGVEVGQQVNLIRVPPGEGGQVSYQFQDFHRTVPLVAIVAALAIAVVVVARWRGLAAMGGLAFAGFILVKFMFPALIAGENPVLVGLIGSSAIMFVVLYAAHGFSARTTTALIGTLFGVILAAGLGWIATKWAHLTGVGAEDDFLLAATAPDMSLTSVVICGVILAGLGVLNDVTITQASAVWELAAADPDQKRLFRSAMRIGRDHIASTVYTIVFATAGASLPVLLLISIYNQPLFQVIQTEMFATEIIRTAVGSIGLVLAVPLTTAIAVAVVRASGRGAVPVAVGAGDSDGGGADEGDDLTDPGTTRSQFADAPKPEPAAPTRRLPWRRRTEEVDDSEGFANLHEDADDDAATDIRLPRKD